MCIFFLQAKVSHFLVVESNARWTGPSLCGPGCVSRSERPLPLQSRECAPLARSSENPRARCVRRPRAAQLCDTPLGLRGLQAPRLPQRKTPLGPQDGGTPGSREARGLCVVPAGAPPPPGLRGQGSSAGPWLLSRDFWESPAGPPRPTPSHPPAVSRPGRGSIPQTAASGSQGKAACSPALSFPLLFLET